MKTCLKCSKPFASVALVDGKTRYMSKRKYCLECVPFGERRLNVPRTEDGKRCSSCKQFKIFDDFWKSDLYWDGYSYKCKDCAKRDSKATVDGKRRQVYEYLAQHKCADCPEADPLVLTLDHVRGVKVMAVSAMVSANKPMDQIWDEISKCEVVCANCHKKRTIRRAGQLAWREAV